MGGTYEIFRGERAREARIGFCTQCGRAFERLDGRPAGNAEACDECEPLLRQFEEQFQSLKKKVVINVYPESRGEYYLLPGRDLPSLRSENLPIPEGSVELVAVLPQLPGLDPDGQLPMGAMEYHQGPPTQWEVAAETPLFWKYIGSGGWYATTVAEAVKICREWHIRQLELYIPLDLPQD